MDETRTSAHQSVCQSAGTRSSALWLLCVVTLKCLIAGVGMETLEEVNKRRGVEIIGKGRKNSVKSKIILLWSTICSWIRCLWSWECKQNKILVIEQKICSKHLSGTQSEQFCGKSYERGPYKEWGAWKISNNQLTGGGTAIRHWRACLSSFRHSRKKISSFAFPDSRHLFHVRHWQTFLWVLFLLFIS